MPLRQEAVNRGLLERIDLRRDATTIHYTPAMDWLSKVLGLILGVRLSSSRRASCDSDLGRAYQL